MSQCTYATQELDLTGEICPYTFVKSKLAIEELEDGEVLRVIVDYQQAVADVPRGLSSEGHEILHVTKRNETDWEIVVRKA